MGAWDTEGAPRPGLIRGKYLMDQDNLIFPQYKAKYDHLLLPTSRRCLFCLPPEKYLKDQDIFPWGKAKCDQFLLTNSSLYRGTETDMRS
ncbi:uncharacterized protein [Chiloscyllium punctatum]|uniref:uncharacterized protein isoform X2 n=1 Tax=Chiloscyllium punctatum TaxID=137246 RepID=UPI003B633C3F